MDYIEYEVWQFFRISRSRLVSIILAMYASTIFLTQRISREVELWRHMDMNVQTCEEKQPAPETPSMPLHTQYQLSPYNPCCGLVFEVIKTHSDLLLLDPKSTKHVSGNWTMQDWENWKRRPAKTHSNMTLQEIYFTAPRPCFCWETKLESTSWIKFADWGTGKQVSSHTICMCIHVYIYIYIWIYTNIHERTSAQSQPLTSQRSLILPWDLLISTLLIRWFSQIHVYLEGLFNVFCFFIATHPLPAKCCR